MKNNSSASRRRKAQSALEYTICVSIVLMAIIAMVTYVKRGVSGRYADVVRATVKSANTTQYEPYYYNSSAASKFTLDSNLVVGNRGEQVRNFNSKIVSQGSESYSVLK